MLSKFIRRDLQPPPKKIEGIWRQPIVQASTVSVSEFYEKAPFPNFDGLETKFDLLRILESNFFLRDFKETIGLGKTVIEVGSGTSQLALALAADTNNSVFALDPTRKSLELARGFAVKNNIENITFINADIFDDPFEEEVFDFVWCSGVLHHTLDSYEGFKTIVKWLKPDGLIIVGLYNTFGRLRTNVRQKIYDVTGRSSMGASLVRLLDPHLRNRLSPEKDLAWFRDQYEHPIERKHSLDEVLDWFDAHGIRFLGSLPSCELEHDYTMIKNMSGRRGTRTSRLIAQLGMLFSTAGREGGLFIAIGRKNSESAQIENLGG